MGFNFCIFIFSGISFSFYCLGHIHSHPIFWPSKHVYSCHLLVTNMHCVLNLFVLIHSHTSRIHSMLVKNDTRVLGEELEIAVHV